MNTSSIYRHHSDEEIVYITIPGTGRKLFVHIHLPEKPQGKAFFLLNPILDEAKLSHNFQTATARRLSSAGAFVFRFDYYGTGDSPGELYDFDLYEAAADAKEVIRCLAGKYAITDIALLGIRAGADLAMQIASKYPGIKTLHLVEPLVNGSRFLVEQRFRRKTFIKINNITGSEQRININGREFEDYQGFPLSEPVLAFLGGLNSQKVNLSGREIFLYLTSAVNSGKRILQLYESLSVSNTIKTEKIPCGDFWASLDSTDTWPLTEKITQNFKI